MLQYEKPRWLRDVARFLPLKSQFVLSGNVRDLQAKEVTQGQIAALPLPVTLAMELYGSGYQEVRSFDPVHGLRRVASTGAYESATEGTTLEHLANHIEAVLSSDQPTALLVDFASRLVVRSSSLSSPEHQFFSRALVHSHAAKARPAGPERRPFFNTLIWIVEKEGDLPDWLWVGNPRVRHVPVPRPDHIARRALAGALLRTLPGEVAATEAQSSEDTFVEETEGLLLVDLNSIVQLGRNEQVPRARISDAVRRYKVGVTEDPWQKLDREKIRDGYQTVVRRVRGQDHAATHIMDIIKRAVTGVGAGRRGGRPRGVAFLAGPTGVGKTELAKTITHLLFGDESAYIRFDMSEFSAEHADQRLLGAPPGYVGYDVGGELTNAIREKPFSVVLFDEIEKAHPRLLDKFLQILDDGVLTSGRGDRVYFSEALILFTSNLGIYRTNADGERVLNVAPDELFDTVKVRVRTEIERHFKVVLNRPELLNRIGENIIVFDFIRPDVALEILGQMIDTTLNDLPQRVEILPEARKKLAELCLSDLSNGGRGIRNQVEVHLVNPLARALFDAKGSHFAIVGVETGTVTTLRLQSTESVV